MCRVCSSDGDVKLTQECIYFSDSVNPKCLGELCLCLVIHHRGLPDMREVGKKDRGDPSLVSGRTLSARRMPSKPWGQTSSVWMDSRPSTVGLRS